jgi:hypothetical protein
MTYRPPDEAFGPPLWQRLPSFLHVAFATAIVSTVFIVERGPHEGRLYEYMFMQRHIIDARTLSVIVIVSSVASLLRAGMRGVKVRSDSVEFRDVVSSVWPRVKRYRWAQIDGIHLVQNKRAITLDLWDGTVQLLPSVSDYEGLARTLERVALARAIPLSGGSGLDDFPESTDFPASEEAPDEA